MLVRGLVLFVVSLVAAAPPQPTGDKAVICHYYNWAIYRNGHCQYQPSDIDPDLCTHIIYAYATLSGDTNPTLSSSDPNADLPEGHDGYHKVTALKKKNPNLKVLLASGGYMAGGGAFSYAFRTAESRDNLAANTISFLKKYGFDGLSVDWMWPGVVSIDDWDNLRRGGKVLRAAYDKEGMILAVTVSASPATMPQYHADGLNYFHFVQVYSMDFRGRWDRITGPPTALKKCDEDTLDAADKLNVDYAIQFYLKAGVKPLHLVMGTCTEGRSFQLSDPHHHKMGSPSTGGGGSAGVCLPERGVWGYNEFCLDPHSGWNHVEAKECAVEYHYKKDEWVSIESAATMYAHGAYAAENNLAGASVWSLDTDDFHGKCGDKRYPLINALKDGLNGGDGPTTTPKPTTSPKPTTTPKPPPTTTPKPDPTTTQPTTTHKPDPTTTKPPPTTTTKPVPTTTKPKPTTTPKPDPTTTKPTTTHKPDPTTTKTPPTTTTKPVPTTTKPNPTTTPKPVPTTTHKKPTTPENCIPECHKEGFLRNFCNCQLYYECQLMPNGQFWRLPHRCHNDLVFDLVTNKCVSLADVPECQ